MNNIDPLVLATIISTLGAGVGVVVSWLLTRRKSDSETVKNTADANESVSTSVTLLLDNLNTRIKTLNDEVTRVEAERKQDKEQYETEMASMKKEISEMKSLVRVSEGKMQEMRGGMNVLLGQLKQADITPKYILED